MTLESAGSQRQAFRPLPRAGAFVLQLDAGCLPGSGQFQGRVEHVVSGAALTFQSVDDLVRFVGTVLAESADFAETAG